MVQKKTDGGGDVPFPAGGFNYHDELVHWMKTRAEDIGKSPKTLGQHRGSLRSAEAKELWRQGVKRAQLLASHAGNTPPFLSERKDDDHHFLEICSVTGTESSKRQYSKFLKKRGKARAELREALGTQRVAADFHLQQCVHHLGCVSRDMEKEFWERKDAEDEDLEMEIKVYIEAIGDKRPPDLDDDDVYFHHILMEEEQKRIIAVQDAENAVQKAEETYKRLIPFAR